ncbi:MAG: allophanate hydrolase [Loktanella salsilacus]
MLPDRDDLEGGTLRLMPGPQTQMFSAAERARFAQTVFHRSPQANRTALPLMKDGAGFAALGGNPVSDFIAPGDVQITGDGTPVVMMAECQTVGGYPRIGTVIAADLVRAAQAPVGAALRFEWVDVGRADALFVPEAQQLTALKAAVRPLVRDPRDMHDLLSYQLISGVTAGRDMEPLP